MKTIVIDAGHGGHDLGAIMGDRAEKDDNLRLALAVQKRLRDKGQRVIMTRSTDVFIPLEERSAISNRNQADLFVSLHRNANTSRLANGIETFVQNNSPSVNTVYAANVQNELVKAGAQTNRGVSQENFSVLRNTNAPAMLVESGFISNSRDNQLFDQNFEAYADAITRGILKSLGESGGTSPGTYPGRPLRLGSSGNAVYTLQTYLNKMANTYPSIPKINADGRFGPATVNAVIAAQIALGLTADGIVGPMTWNGVVR